jgi:ABC-type uncharacterized transport system permease subunit
MSENKGFFSEIKNQIVTGIGLVITAGFGLLIANMQSIFEPKEEVQQPPMMEQTITIPEGVKDTLVITKTIKVQPSKPKKEEEEISW